MRVLLIHAHPLADSFSAVVRDAVRRGLEAAGHAVTVLDLHAEGFDPRMAAEERRTYHDEAVNQRGKERYVALLRDAEGIVFVFPVWSFGVPAILKGFFDRLLMPGVGFHLRDGKAKPGLTHVQSVMGVATYGRPQWLVRLFIGDLPRRQIVRYFRWMCGFWSTRARYVALYDMNNATAAERTAFLARAAAAGRAIR